MSTNARRHSHVRKSAGWVFGAKFTLISLMGIAGFSVILCGQGGPPAAAPQGLTPATSSSANVGSIQGTVVSAETNEPLAGAHVEARLSRYGSRRRATAAEALTDSQGRFELSGLPPDLYIVSAALDGFVTWEYGQHARFDMGVPLKLSAGQRISDISIQLHRSAAITGHVYDENGKPFAGVEVAALQPSYTSGRLQLEASLVFRAGSPTRVNPPAETNELGEFRISDLLPGQYFVWAKYAPNERIGKAMFDPAHPGRLKNPLPPRGYPETRKNPGPGKVYLETFYPGVHHGASASPIVLREGEEFSSADFKLQSVQTVTVKGQIISFGCGEPPWEVPGPRIALWPSDPDAHSFSTSAIMTPEGAFEIKGVVPGAYSLSISNLAFGKKCQGRMALQVGEAGLEGVALTMAPPFEINGKLFIEGHADGDFSRVIIALSVRDRGVKLFNNAHATPGPDGSFQLENVAEGQYDIGALRLPKNYFIKSARLAGVDVLATGITVDSDHPPGRLEIVVSPQAASVEGVISENHRPLAGATVALVPESLQGGDRELVALRLFKSAFTDASGHFNLQGIEPGDYRVFAWDSIPANAYKSPEFLQQYANSSTRVHVTEGSHSSLQLNAIPTS